MRPVFTLLALLAGGCEFVVPGLETPGGDLGADLAVADDLAVPIDLAVPPPDLTLPVARSCTELIQRTPGTPNGVYPIDPGLSPGTAPLQIYCDMTDDGGGWNLVMRTVYDFTKTQTLIGPYATFYSDSIGAPDPGNAYRLAGRHWPALNATSGHLVRHVPRATDGTDCLPLVYFASGSSWIVTPPDGGANIGPVVATIDIFNGTSQLSTTDEGPGSGCVTAYNGAPWTYLGCCYTCPSYGMPVGHPGFTYPSTPDFYLHTAIDRCAPKSIDSGAIYFSNVFEYYVR